MEAILTPRARTYWFGRNWKQFLDQDYSAERLTEAERSLSVLFGSTGLQGKAFLDIGCGSGLFSLAAWKLGAARVVSIDVDPDSVDCCRRLAAGLEQSEGRSWAILQGSVLDQVFVSELPECDIVYSWGVLHHTGDMWRAIETAGRLVPKGGTFAIGIYNWRNGRRGTTTWQRLKRWYCTAPRWQSRLWEMAYTCGRLLYMLAMCRNPVAYIRNYKKNRGMSWFRDISDWLGGYPYEAATPGEVLQFVRDRLGFELTKQNINCDLGISEFVFDCTSRRANDE